MPRVLYAPKWLDKEVLFAELATYIAKPLETWRIRFYPNFENGYSSTVRVGKDVYYKFTRYSHPGLFWVFYTALENKIGHSTFFYKVLPLTGGVHISGTKEFGGVGAGRPSRAGIYTYIPDKLATVSITKRTPRISYKWELTERGREIGAYLDEVFMHPNVRVKFAQQCVLIRQEINIQRARANAKKYFPASFQRVCGDKRCSNTMALYDVVLPPFPVEIRLDDVDQRAQLMEIATKHYKTPNTIIKMKPPWQNKKTEVIS